MWYSASLKKWSRTSVLIKQVGINNEGVMDVVIQPEKGMMS